jgi:hypothetical protein
MITEEALAAALAQRVLGWQTAPNRYITSGRSWIPRWRFAPFSRLDDALLLLDRASSNYKLTMFKGGTFTAEVHVDNRIGKAFGEPKARTITTALVRALGLKLPDEGSDPASMPPRRRNPQPPSKVDGI